MSLTLEKLILRLEDPGTPVVWIDPTAPPDIFERLPDALRNRGFSVLDLDFESPIVGLGSLLDRLGSLAALQEYYRPTFTTLRDALLRLTDASPLGFAVIFRNPDILRQNDEGAFEDFLETLEFVHDSKYELRGQMFKLAVRG